jgi:hypothetical protein
MLWCCAKIGCGSDPFVWATARYFRVTAEVGSFLFAVLNAVTEDGRRGEEVVEICDQLR